MPKNFKPEDKMDLRDNVTLEEKGILNRREEYSKTIEEYSKEIERDRANGMDVSDQEENLTQLKKEYERLGGELEGLDSSLN